MLVMEQKELKISFYNSDLNLLFTRIKMLLQEKKPLCCKSFMYLEIIINNINIPQITISN